MNKFGGIKMIKRAIYTLCVLFVLSLVVAPAALAAQKHDSIGSFGEASQTINFDDLTFSDTVSDFYLESHGVEFADNDKITPILIAPYNRNNVGTSSEPYSIVADGDWPETSANEPLKIIFSEGQKKVGMYVGNARDSTTAVLIAYNNQGQEIASYSRDDLNDKVNTFMGISADEPIYTVTLDFGDTLLSEEIDNLMFEPVDEIPVLQIPEEVCSSTNSLEVGDEVTYNVNGEIISVKVTDMQHDAVQISVEHTNRWDNRQTSREWFYEGETRPFSNQRLSVDNLIYQDYAGGVKSVDFCFNGKKGREVQEPSPPGNYFDYGEAVWDLSNSYKAFIETNDWRFLGSFVVGANAPAVDNLAMTDIATGFSGVQIVDATKLDYEVVNPKHLDLIAVGNPCNNQVVKQLLGSPASCNLGLSKGQGLISLNVGEKGHVQVVVSGADKEGTRKAAKLYAKYVEQRLTKGTSEIQLEGSKVIVDGTKSNPYLVSGSVDVARGTTRETTEVPTTPSRESQRTSSPTPATREVPVTETLECTNGCKPNGQCLPFGTRLIQGEPVYCSIEGTLQPQQDLGESCQNNYECSSNQCSNGQCIDLSGQLDEARGFLQEVIDWLRSLFGPYQIR
jgi:hypothetical protein